MLPRPLSEAAAFGGGGGGGGGRAHSPPKDGWWTLNRDREPCSTRIGNSKNTCVFDTDGIFVFFSRTTKGGTLQDHIGLMACWTMGPIRGGQTRGAGEQSRPITRSLSRQKFMQVITSPRFEQRRRKGKGWWKKPAHMCGIQHGQYYVHAV